MSSNGSAKDKGQLSPGASNKENTNQTPVTAVLHDAGGTPFVKKHRQSLDGATIGDLANPKVLSNNDFKDAGVPPIHAAKIRHAAKKKSAPKKKPGFFSDLLEACGDDLVDQEEKLDIEEEAELAAISEDQATVTPAEQYAELARQAAKEAAELAAISENQATVNPAEQYAELARQAAKEAVSEVVEETMLKLTNVMKLANGKTEDDLDEMDMNELDSIFLREQKETLTAKTMEKWSKLKIFYANAFGGNLDTDKPNTAAVKILKWCGTTAKTLSPSYKRSKLECLLAYFRWQKKTLHKSVLERLRNQHSIYIKKERKEYQNGMYTTVSAFSEEDLIHMLLAVLDKFQGELPSKELQILTKLFVNFSIGRRAIELEWIAAGSIWFKYVEKEDGTVQRQIGMKGLYMKSKELGHFDYSFRYELAILLLLVHLERIGAIGKGEACKIFNGEMELRISPRFESIDQLQDKLCRSLAIVKDNLSDLLSGKNGSKDKGKDKDEEDSVEDEDDGDDDTEEHGSSKVSFETKLTESQVKKALVKMSAQVHVFDQEEIAADETNNTKNYMFPLWRKHDGQTGLQLCLRSDPDATSLFNGFGREVGYLPSPKHRFGPSNCRKGNRQNKGSHSLGSYNSNYLEMNLGHKQVTGNEFYENTNRVREQLGCDAHFRGQTQEEVNAFLKDAKPLPSFDIPRFFNPFVVPNKDRSKIPSNEEFLKLGTDSIDVAKMNGLLCYETNCQKSFEYLGGLFAHMRTHDGKEIDENTREVKKVSFVCPGTKCNKIFDTWSKFHKHVTWCSSTSLDFPVKQIAVRQATENQYRNKNLHTKHFCPVDGCYESFTKKENLTNHYAKQHKKQLNDGINCQQAIDAHPNQFVAPKVRRAVLDPTKHYCPFENCFYEGTSKNRNKHVNKAHIGSEGGDLKPEAGKRTPLFAPPGSKWNVEVDSDPKYEKATLVLSIGENRETQQTIAKQPEPLYDTKPKAKPTATTGLKKKKSAVEKNSNKKAGDEEEYIPSGKRKAVGPPSTSRRSLRATNVKSYAEPEVEESPKKKKKKQAKKDKVDKLLAKSRSNLEKRRAAGELVAEESDEEEEEEVIVESESHPEHESGEL